GGQTAAPPVCGGTPGTGRRARPRPAAGLAPPARWRFAAMKRLPRALRPLLATLVLAGACAGLCAALMDRVGGGRGAVRGVDRSRVRRAADGAQLSLRAAAGGEPIGRRFARADRARLLAA